VRTRPLRANVAENARATIGAKTMIPLRNIAAWPSRSRYFIADLLDANETRSPTSDLSDESIADTFVSVRMELPAHSHAAQPIRKPDGGMRSGTGRTRVGHDVGLPARRHCRPRRSLDRTRERMPRSTLLSTSRCGRAGIDTLVSQIPSCNGLGVPHVVQSPVRHGPTNDAFA